MSPFLRLFVVCLCVMTTMFSSSVKAQTNLGYKIDSQGKRRSLCYMPPGEFKAKLAAVRRAVGCEFNQYNAFECSATLGLAAVGATGAAAAAVAKKIRNPGAKLCSLAGNGTPIPAFETSIADALISLFYAPPAFAASCPAEIDFLKRDIDRAVDDHLRGLDGKMKQQSAELVKAREQFARADQDLKKAWVSIRALAFERIFSTNK